MFGADVEYGALVGGVLSLLEVDALGFDHEDSMKSVAEVGFVRPQRGNEIGVSSNSCGWERPQVDGSRTPKHPVFAASGCALTTTHAKPTRRLFLARPA